MRWFRKAHRNRQARKKSKLKKVPGDVNKGKPLSGLTGWRQERRLLRGEEGVSCRGGFGREVVCF